MEEEKNHVSCHEHTKVTRLICTAATLGFVLISPWSFAPGTDLSPDFPAPGGRWRHKLADGSRERILCRAQYSVGEAGRSLVQHLRCASASYRLEISANIQDQGVCLYGSWSEPPMVKWGPISGSVGIRG